MLSLALPSLFGFGLLIAPLARTAPALLAEDHLRGWYLENGASGRRLATLDAYLLPTQKGRKLWLRISAIGAGVDPVPGEKGLPGANHVTAHELARIVGGGRLEVRSRSEGFDVPGSFVTGSDGGIPERRVGDDGRLGVGEYAIELPTKLHVSSPLPLEGGEGRTEITVDGDPRLVIVWRAERGKVSLVRMESHAPSK